MSYSICAASGGAGMVGSNNLGAVNKGFRRVLILSDSMPLWECPCQGRRPMTEVQMIIREGRVASGSLDVGAITKVQRSLVKEAHDLGKE